MSENDAPTQRPIVGIKIGGRTLAVSGPTAVAFLLILLVSVIAVVTWLVIRRPESVKSALTSPLWLSAALWVVMIVYWNRAAKRSAPAKSRESEASRGLHQLLLNLGLLLAFVRLPWSGMRWLPASPLTVPIGLSVQVGAMLFDVWAMRCLGRNWSGAVAIKVDHELVKTGPYRLVRHPIYTAMIGMYLGTAIVSGELHGLLAVILVVIAYARKTRMEERGLREAFGRAYEDYARESWAFVPWVF